jgi:hypothetical protein
MSAEEKMSTRLTVSAAETADTGYHSGAKKFHALFPLRL